MTKYIVDLYLDGYPTQAEQDAAALVFIHEQLNFSGSSVKVEPHNTQSWISVGERLPPREPEPILHASHSVDVLCFDGETVRSGYYYFTDRYWIMYDYVDKPNVTHWCPLPTPPTP